MSKLVATIKLSNETIITLSNECRIIDKDSLEDITTKFFDSKLKGLKTSTIIVKNSNDEIMLAINTRLVSKIDIEPFVKGVSLEAWIDATEKGENF